MTTPTEASSETTTPRARRAPRGGHRRGRLRRARRGDPAAPGRASATSSCSSAGRRRRRHLAGQHLPGLRLRRAVAALLVLVRAEPGLEPDVLARSRRSGPTCSDVRRPVRPRAAPAASATRCATPRWDDDGAALADARRARATDRRRARRRRPARCASPSIPDIPGLETFAGTVFHSARWRHDHDLTGRASPSIGTGASRDPVRAARSRPTVGALTRVPAHRAVDHAAPRPRRSAARRAGGCTGASRARSGSCAAGVYWARELLALGLPAPAALRLARSGSPSGTCAGRSRDPELRAAAHAGLHDGLQADPALQRLPARAATRQRRAW